MEASLESCRPVRPTHRSTLLRPCLASVAALLAGCSHDLFSDFNPPVVCRTDSPVQSSVFLVGDSGAPQLPTRGSEGPDALVDPLLLHLRADVAAQSEKLGPERTGVVFLGDNVYPAGLPPAGAKDRAEKERVLVAQIAAVGRARGLFTLGNHDWNQGKQDGWQRAMAQVEYLGAQGDRISVHPGGACPGPEVVDFGEQIRFVFFDLWATIYQQDTNNAHQAHCPMLAGDGRLIAAVNRILDETTPRRTVVVTHAPLLTGGPHGGYFPWHEHIFPLRVFQRDLWIPLPIIGSIFPIARMLGVTDVDVMGPRYRAYIAGTRQTLRPGNPALVAAGHEHSLQIHIDPAGVYHAVSGAGSIGKVDYVRRMPSDLMSLAAPGYMRLDSYPDGKLRLLVIALDDELARRNVFDTCIP
jgi:hypothetical protein